MHIRNILRNRIYNLLDQKLDIYDKKFFMKMRNNGHLIYLSELIPFFNNINMFAFGTGGSIANLKDVNQLKDFNLMMTTTGPYYCYVTYGFIPNLWVLTYAPVIETILEKEKDSPLDFSNTFILVPTNDSINKICINTPAVKQLMLKHPEAMYVLYRCILHQKKWPIKIPGTYLMKHIEPIHGIHSTILDNLFLPLCFYLDVSTVYFSGVDLIPTTGHFWDRNLHYQRMDGKPLNFPDEKLIFKSAEIVQDICKKNGKHIYRLEKSETLLQNYPYIDFSKSLIDASPKITPNEVRKKI